LPGISSLAFLNGGHPICWFALQAATTMPPFKDPLKPLFHVSHELGRQEMNVQRLAKMQAKLTAVAITSVFSIGQGRAALA
jgi:hypothetical protein